MVSFNLNKQPFTAVNGGPQFKFSEAISFQIKCEDQAEVDFYWEKLAEGGNPEKQREKFVRLLTLRVVDASVAGNMFTDDAVGCGWVTDKFGVSWQVVPNALEEIMNGTDVEGKKRTMEAMLKMRKLDIAGLRRAAEGKNDA